MEIQNYIAGEMLLSESQNVFRKFSPFTGAEIATVTQSSAMDCVMAIQHGKKYFTQFKETTYSDRAALLEKLASALEEDSGKISQLEALHQGLSSEFVLDNSVLPSIKILRETAKSLLSSADDGSRSPMGVVSIISSWCLSLKLIVERLAPALAAGNTLIIKPSELSPITGSILADLFIKAEFPAGLVAILQGGANIGEVLSGHPGIAAVSAVGNQGTLESVAKNALNTLKKVQISGANKGAALVLKDFAPHDMPELFKSFLMGQGQMCWNSTRWFINESFSKEFLENVEESFHSLKPLRDPSDSGVWSPVIDQSAVERAEKYLGMAKSETAKHKHFSDNLPAEGFYVAPHFLLDLPHCSTLQQDDLQAPHLIISAVKYQHEAVKWANTGYLGHSASVWGPEEKMPKLIRGLEFEKIWVNRWLRQDPETVLGFKQSFYGNADTAWNGSFYSNVRTSKFP